MTVAASTESVPARVDVAVAGAGIVGLAVAYELLARRPGLRVVVLEKEHAIGNHQTGHNSGVIHAGIYYKPGSLKARLCTEGRRLMIEFCERRSIPVELCGKVIVAASPTELVHLREIYERGVANGVVGLELVGPERLQELEPSVVGHGAIHSPATGITDYTLVARALADEIESRGGVVVTGAAVTGFRPGAGGLRVVQSSLGETKARYVITCCGLQSDRVARLSGASESPKIVPFRGTYYHLTESASARFRGLVYPVPDPKLPFFLGVHFTKQLSGVVWAGPTAVLALAREGYRVQDLHIGELWEALSYRGFRALMRRSLRLALREVKLELSKSAFVTELRKMAPWIGPDDLRPGHSGVRAQALGEDGTLVEDFWLDRADGTVHVRNAPSPAATSSLAIARMIADDAGKALDLAS